MKLNAAQHKRMVMIFDPDGSEVPTEKNKAPHSTLQSILSISIVQKDYAILTSSAQLKLLAQKIDSFISEPGKNHDNIARACNFNPVEWDIYHIPESELFLLIPKIKKEFYKQKIRLSDKNIEIEAFKRSSFKSFNKISIKELIEWIGIQIPKNPIKTVLALAKVFFTRDDVELNSDIINNLENTKNASFEDLPAKTDYVLSEFTPWNFFIIGHGRYSSCMPTVADFGEAELSNFLDFLNKQLFVNVAAISSCYSGGKNINMINLRKTIDGTYKTRNLHFIVAVLSSTDSVASISMGFTTCFPENSALFNLNVSVDCKGFFDLIDGTESMRKEKSIGGKKKPSIAHQISKALHKLDPTYDIKNIPQILIPNHDWFNAWESKKKDIDGKILNDNTLIINKSVIQKNIIQRTDINISGRKYVLVYPRIIPIKLNIKFLATHKFEDNFWPLFISMEKKSDAVHIFNEVNLVMNEYSLDRIKSNISLAGGSAADEKDPKKIVKKYLELCFLSKIPNESIKKFFLKKLTFSSGTSGKLYGEFNNIFVTDQNSLTTVYFDTDSFDQKIKTDIHTYKNELESFLKDVPNWKREKKEKSDLQVKLEDLSGKLIFLKNKLLLLKETLSTLQVGLLGKFPSLSKTFELKAKQILTNDQQDKIKVWNKLRIDLYKLISEWIKRLQKEPMFLSEKEITDYINLISRLPTDEKINAGQVLINKINREKLVKIANIVVQMIEGNPSLAPNPDLAAFSIQLALEFNAHSDKDSDEIKNFFIKKNNWAKIIYTLIYNELIDTIEKKPQDLKTSYYYFAIQFGLLSTSIFDFNDEHSTKIYRSLLPTLINRKDKFGNYKDFISDTTVNNLVKKIQNIADAMKKYDNYIYLTTDPVIQEIIKR